MLMFVLLIACDSSNILNKNTKSYESGYFHDAHCFESGIGRKVNTHDVI